VAFIYRGSLKSGLISCGESDVRRFEEVSTVWPNLFRDYGLVRWSVVGRETGIDIPNVPVLQVFGNFDLFSLSSRRVGR